MTPHCVTDPLPILSPSGTFRNAQAAGLSGRWVPGRLSTTVGGRRWPVPATSRLSQGGSGKSGHGRDGLQLCHLQKSLREPDMPGPWKVSKALGLSQTLVPLGL